MAYQYQNPYGSLYQAQPYQNPYAQQYQQPVPKQLYVEVNGEDGANAYRMGPNEAIPLFDMNSDVFYFKRTDGAGYPTMQKFKYELIEQEKSQQTNYITRDEFMQEMESLRTEIKELMTNAKQPVEG